MKSIRKYLKEVRNSLREYEESLTEREKEEFVEYCRNAIRDGEGDYSDKHYLELYILRYALAYGLQFSRMYAAILRDMGKPENIRVSSFGCGTGIDYWGLTYAAELLNEIDCDVDYRGYDPSEWSHRIMEEGRQRKNDTILYNKLDISGNIYEGIDTFDAYLEGIDQAIMLVISIVGVLIAFLPESLPKKIIAIGYLLVVIVLAIVLVLVLKKKK